MSLAKLRNKNALESIFVGVALADGLALVHQHAMGAVERRACNDGVGELLREREVSGLRSALESSTRPPRMTPWLYVHSSPLLFWHASVRPSLMRFCELIMPLLRNQVY